MIDIPDHNLGGLNRKKILLAVLLVFLLVFTASAGYTYTKIDVNSQKATFNTNATVFKGNKSNKTLRAGIATGQGMSFGNFNSFFNKTKTLNLSADDTSLVKIETSGNISDRLEYQEIYFFEGRKQIPFEMAGNETGFYNGTIVLDMKTAQNKWGERWLELLYRYS